MTADPRHRTAVHEAAHAVVATVLGLSASVEIDPQDNGLCRLERRPWPDGFGDVRALLGLPDGDAGYVMRRIAVALAGDAATDLLLAEAGRAGHVPIFWPASGIEAPPELVDYVNGEGDDEQARSLALALVGPGQAIALVNWLRVVARELVSGNVPAIAAVARALLAVDGQRLDGRQVAELTQRAAVLAGHHQTENET